MKMKNNLFPLLMAALFTCVLFSCMPDNGAGSGAGDSLGIENPAVEEPFEIDYNKVYACPDHTDQHSVSPGKCPVCGKDMKLVKPAEGKGSSDSSSAK